MIDLGAWHGWVVLGVVLLVILLWRFSITLIALFFSTLATAITLMILPGDEVYGIAYFCAYSAFILASVYGVNRPALKRKAEMGQSLKAPASIHNSLHGRIFTLNIEEEDGSFRVNWAGQEWRVVGKDLEPGQHVQVVLVEDNTLTVKRVD